MKSVAGIASAVGLLASTASAIQPIVIKGKHFFYENGTEFFIRGVAYQQDVSSDSSASFIDPLSDKTLCERDVPILKELGTNAIRVYAIDPTLDHTDCMDLLAENEIYVIQDLSNPTSSIIRSDPKWNTELYANYAAVVDEMAQYNHTLGFFAGNEVSNEAANTNASAYVKAAVRDMKAYISEKGYRSIGVGYATNDDASIRVDLKNYFDCAPEDSGVDFWGYNIYSWCGDSTYEESGYKERTDEFQNYTVPAFFAEYGCNEVQPRPFSEVQAIYGDKMTEVWSGGIVYQYFQETNDYGLVTVIDSTSVSKLPDFTSLSAQLASATPSLTAMSDYTPTYTAMQACPTTDDNWSAPSDLPPIASKDLCDCMLKSLTCIAKTDLTDKETASEFGTVCGLTDCTGITSSVFDGITYGAYSVCNSYEQLSWAYNQYYLDQNKVSTACDFGGNAEIQKAAQDSTCKSLMDEAGGAAGTGTVTSNPTSKSTSTAGANSSKGKGSSGSGSSSSSGSSSDSSSLASGLVLPRMDLWSAVAMGAYLLVAGGMGAGALLL